MSDSDAVALFSSSFRFLRSFLVGFGRDPAEF